ncbi:MAG: helix-turn-helix domain-containing protein [Bacteroidota bacterium]
MFQNFYLSSIIYVGAITNETMVTRKNNKEEFSNLQVEFGRILSSTRKDKKMTQHDLEESSGISLRMISDLERGLLQPTLATLVKLAKGLNTTAVILMEKLQDKINR